MSYRPIIKEIRYSLNSDTLDRTFTFKPSDKMYEVGDELPYLAVPSRCRICERAGDVQRRHDLPGAENRAGEIAKSRGHSTAIEG